MTLFTEFADAEKDDCGVFFSDFVTAVGIWRYMNPSGTTVAAAALMFNTTPAIVRLAVAEHPYLFAAWDDDEDDPAEQLIDFDGE